MMNKNKLSTAIVAGLVGVGLTMASGAAIAGKANMEKLEKCYGIAKVGKNDCGGVGTGHTCQGQSTKAGDPKDWMLVPKGTCDKIVGGSLKSAASDAKSS